MMTLCLNIYKNAKALNSILKYIKYMRDSKLLKINK